MRLYYVETKNASGVWIQGRIAYESCRRAHTAARAVKDKPARVLMLMRKIELKDLAAALRAVRRQGS